MSLWANIRKRRAAGKPRLKPGDKNYPKTLDIGEADKRIPRKKGQPAGSDKHSDLYTDENPVGTIKGLKFATVDDAEKSVKKIENSGKTHAHKIQAAIAMEQRARVMGKKAEAAVYRKYIEKMKKITKERQMKKKNEDVLEAIIVEREGAYGMFGPTLSKEIKQKEIKAGVYVIYKGGTAKKPVMTERVPKRLIKKRLKDGWKLDTEYFNVPGVKVPKDYFKGLVDEDAPATNTSSIPNPAQTAMGPKFTTTNVMDRRRKKRPDVLKRFRQHMMDSA